MPLGEADESLAMSGWHSPGTLWSPTLSQVPISSSVSRLAQGDPGSRVHPRRGLNSPGGRELGTAPWGSLLLASHLCPRRPSPGQGAVWGLLLRQSLRASGGRAQGFGGPRWPWTGCPRLPPRVPVSPAPARDSLQGTPRAAAGPVQGHRGPGDSGVLGGAERLWRKHESQWNEMRIRRSLF